MKKSFCRLTGYAGIALALSTAATGAINGLTILGIITTAASFALAERTTKTTITP
jgi:hypothetical protein